MNQNFDEKFSKLTNEQLENYLLNIPIYTYESIQSAIRVLKSRGREFTNEELERIDKELEIKRLKIEKDNESIWKNGWNKNITKDPNAPELYSQRSILIFSVFFMVAIGAYLQALNCKSLGNKRGYYLTSIFGILYTILQTVLLSNLFDKPITGFTQAFCFGGALILDSYFWNKFIGKKFQYRKKPIWKPLLISILIMIPLIAAYIYSRE